MNTEHMLEAMGVFAQVFENAERLKSYQMNVADFAALPKQQRAALAGAIAGELAISDPMTCFALLDACIHGGKG